MVSGTTGGNSGLRFGTFAHTPASVSLQVQAGITKGTTTPGKGASVGQVTMEQIREIAQKKMQDLNANDVEAASAMLVGSARSMGLQVVE